MLAIGCLLELPELLFDIWPGFFSWFTWKPKIRHEKFEQKIKVIGLVGWVLVAGGIVGEGVFESLQNRAEGQLQTFNDIPLREARLTASNARDSATVAGNVAKDSRRDAEEAQGAADKVRGEADVLGKQIKAEQKEAKIVEDMVQRVGPRETLIKLNRGRISKALEPFANQKFVLMVCGPESPEKRDFLVALLGPLAAAKWLGYNSRQPCSEEWGGVLLTSLPLQESSTKARDALNALLNGININATIQTEAIDGTTGAKLGIVDEPAKGILKYEPTMLIIRVGYDPMFSSEFYDLDGKDGKKSPN